jgi:hypothetical protein
LQHLREYKNVASNKRFRGGYGSLLYYGWEWLQVEEQRDAAMLPEEGDLR